MKTKYASLILIIAAIALAGCVNSTYKAPLLPASDFFKNPEKVQYQLSPDGKKISYLKPWNNRLNIFVRNIGDSTGAVRITSSENRDVAGYKWINGNRLIYIIDASGDENFSFTAVNADGTGETELLPGGRIKGYIVDILEQEKNYILAAFNIENSSLFDVYKMNIETGEKKIVYKNPGNVTRWLTDHNGVIRIAVKTDGVNRVILYRQNETKNFTPLVYTDFRETVHPLAFTYDNKKIYAASNIGRDKTAIVLYDPETEKEEEVLFEHPQVDVEKIILSDKEKKIAGVEYFTKKREYSFFDSGWKDMFEFLQNKLPGYEVVIEDRCEGEKVFLVRTYSDKSLGSYYYYDSRENSLEKLADVSPWINEKDMADVKPVSYKARDGLTIHGYLTLPKGYESKNLPVVVFPHGGPWIRSKWAYNSTTQFLANRGYAVLEMNFRGSGGYGREFWEAGFKEWGGKMQDDITDGVDWLIKQGIADKDRIGIFGYSYGGYAALAGLTFTPDYYACGVDFAGIANLFSFLESIPPHWEPFREMLHEMVGDPKADSLMLYNRSPYFHTKNIKAPVMIVHGAQDSKVDKKDIDKMVASLKKNGVDVTYIVEENEGHYFYNEETRIKFYESAEKFLQKHLGGRATGETLSSLR